MEEKQKIIERWKVARTHALSKMFDNVRPDGIYPTTDFFEELDSHFEELIEEYRSQPSPPEQGKHAIEFAEWINKNQWKKNPFNLKWYNSIDHPVTTAELYKLFNPKWAEQADTQTPVKGESWYQTFKKEWYKANAILSKKELDREWSETSRSAIMAYKYFRYDFESANPTPVKREGEEEGGEKVK